jgi:uncharacterized Zn finger protein
VPLGPDGWYEAGPPRRVEGGVKARGRRGTIGTAWWSRRFIDMLERICDKGRLGRGRAYARKGQVHPFDVEPGLVEADVQGSRPTPYRVTVRISAYGEAEWARLAAALAEEAIHRAQLLAGEMPPEIEAVFAGCGLPLFPTHAPPPGRRTRTIAPDELDMACTCPDWGFPCKHLSAVLYLLAEKFDDDPFLVLRWRGRDKEPLLASLRVTAGTADAPGPLDAPDVPDAPFTERLTDFYAAGTGLARFHEPSPAPLAPPDLLLRLADPPSIAVRGTALPDILTPLYQRLAEPSPPGDTTAP